MKKIGLNELRQMFQDFYKEKEHYVQKSFSLIPDKDKSLLLINSGMAPLKPYFAGTLKPPAPRMTTCQKCIRTGDIDRVGYTARHATFFEMLGSFSFGDYFKTESLQWGWEFITKVLEMPADKLWPSIYEEDEEAFSIWKTIIGIPEERIVRLGKEDNYWEIGIGPCGPCSEIYFDRGEKYGCGQADCKPGCECDRYVEFWNHVFTQFSRDEAGNYTPLARKNIDTGMGLERLACIVQGVDSIFEIDTFQYILNEVVKLSEVRYGGGSERFDPSIRIITDHIRAVTFLISDGVIPSNEGRGYVLRRLLRRAVRHGKLIGIHDPFLSGLSDKVIDISKQGYPELMEKQAYIRKILMIEEEKFNETIDQGSLILDGYIKEMQADKVTTLGGDKAFKLYDTFGFPVELTCEILSEKGYEVDLDAFYEHMEGQKETARAGRKSETDAGWEMKHHDFSVYGKTVFLGYETLRADGEIKVLFGSDGEVDTLKKGDKGSVILSQTPFYAESGGQVSDKGILSTKETTLTVTGVENIEGVFLHQVVVVEGEVKKGDVLRADVRPASHHNTCRHHTATHLLHKALREVLGDHIRQGGSLVTENSLRFDFTHFEGLSGETLQAVETLVNEKIDAFLPVVTDELSVDEAVRQGATALFDEKYGDMVRVVSIGDFSKELCGGTHVTNTGQIGAFKIISENGVAAGVRRIEAITGAALYRHLQVADALIGEVSEKLKTNQTGALSKLQGLIDENRALKKEAEQSKKQAMSGMSGNLIDEAKSIGEVKLITKKFADYSVNDLRALSDELKAKHRSLILVFASVSTPKRRNSETVFSGSPDSGDKITFIVSVTDDLLEKGHHAGQMIKQIAAAAGGGGGGKADMAQAGGKDISRVDAALALAETLIKK